MERLKCNRRNNKKFGRKIIAEKTCIFLITHHINIYYSTGHSDCIIATHIWIHQHVSLDSFLVLLIVMLIYIGVNEP